MRRLAPHHFVRDVAVLGIAACVLFGVGLALESGVAAVLGLAGAVLVAMVVPFIAIYFDEHPAGGAHRHR